MKWNGLVRCQAASQGTASPRVGSSAFILSATGGCSGRQWHGGLLRFFDVCSSRTHYLISLLATNKAHASSIFPSLLFLSLSSALIPFFSIGLIFFQFNNLNQISSVKKILKKKKRKSRKMRVPSLPSPSVEFSNQITLVRSQNYPLK